MHGCAKHVEFCFFFFKQKTAYEITYGDWSSDVCSSDLGSARAAPPAPSWPRPGECPQPSCPPASRVASVPPSPPWRSEDNQGRVDRGQGTGGRGQWAAERGLSPRGHLPNAAPPDR